MLGLIFLRYADVRFTQVEQTLEGKGSGRRDIGKADYQAQGVMYVPETTRFSYLKGLPEGSDIGAALNRVMETIETENPDLKGVLPRDYARFDNAVLAEFLRLIGSIPDDIEGDDAFGKIYEYFLDHGLPKVYDRSLFPRKTAAVFEHVFSAYQGAGRSTCEAAA